VKPIFKPKSIAVIGGGNDLTKPGGRVVQCLRQKGFAALAVVNTRGESVQDLPTYSSVDTLPEPPDLAIVSVPAPHVLPSVRTLADRGTKGFIVLSCGFSELDEQGRRMERELTDVVRRAGGTLIGPNSLGVFTPRYYGTFGGPDHDPEPGTIDLISASGSTAAFIIEAGLERGVPFASLVSVGNSAMVGVEDVLAYQNRAFDESPVRAKLLYLESVSDPQQLLVHARELRRKGCHIVALKAGSSEAGARAASSHTGAMASRDAAVSALFDKAGIIRVTSKSEMVDVAGLVTRLGVAGGRRVAIVTHAGGPGILLADELAKHGFEIPALRPATRRRLDQALSPGSATGNPVDFLAAGTADHLRSIFEILRECEHDRIDSICVIFGSPGLFDVWPALEAILEAGRELPMPVYPVLPSVRTAATEAERFRREGGFFFTDEVALARAMALVHAAAEPADEREPLPRMDQAAIQSVLDEGRGNGRMLQPDQVQRVLRAIGLQCPASATVSTPQEAAGAASAMGFPVVLKVVGPVHKTELGGVVTDVRNEREARETATRLFEVQGAEGVLVQAQVSGIEMIVGASREDRFGHLVVAGLGGVWTEALGDVVFGLAPLSDAEARRLLAGIRTQALLRGFRGYPALNREMAAEGLRRLSVLVHLFPCIRELDINPWIVNGDEFWAVDARIEVDG